MLPTQLPNDQHSGHPELGAILSKHRGFAQKSIRKVAREANLHHGFLSRIESGDRGMSVLTLARVSESLGTAFLFEYLQTVLNIVNAEHRANNNPDRPANAPREQEVQA